MSLLDGLFSKQLPPVCSESLPSIYTKSHPVTAQHVCDYPALKDPTVRFIKATQLTQNHLPSEYVISVAGRQHESIFIKFYLHI